MNPFIGKEPYYGTHHSKHKCSAVIGSIGRRRRIPTTRLLSLMIRRSIAYLKVNKQNGNRFRVIRVCLRRSRTVHYQSVI